MELYVTIPVTEELDKLHQYLASQPTELHVSIDSPVPADRFLIPQSLILIVQHAQRYNSYPLAISIRFLKSSVEISYPLQPRPVPDDSFEDIDTLADLYRNYLNMPTVRQTREEAVISIPLFIS